MYIYTFDHSLFLALNFDGGERMDSFMSLVSTTEMWIPLYLGIFGWVWYRRGWKICLAFAVCLAAAMGLSDMICGIFKHSGLLKHVWESFPPRPRPMYEPSLQGLVHVVKYVRVPYGTVSSHAATVAALALMSALEIRRAWFVVLMAAVTLLICYSRIYLACHFPMDLLLGLAVGSLAGWAVFMLYKKLAGVIEKYA